MRDQIHSDRKAEREKVQGARKQTPRGVEGDCGRTKGLIEEQNSQIRCLESDVKRLSLAEERVKKDAEAKQQQIGILQKAADESRAISSPVERGHQEEEHSDSRLGDGGCQQQCRGKRSDEKEG